MGVARAKSGIPGQFRKISNIVPRQFPAHFRESDSLLIPFIEAYYEWMEQDGGVVFDTAKLLDFRDVDKTDMSRFEQFFRDEFLPSIPTDALADKALLVKHIRSFYKARGTEKSYKFLFRLLYNEDVEISYPYDQILRPSDGIWVKRRIMKVDAFDDGIETLAGRKIYGVNSNAACIVESVTISQTPEYKFATLVVTSISGVFFVDEPVETRDTNPALPKVFARILGQVTSSIIESKGTGYTTGQIITFSDPGDGYDVVARIGSVGINGEILTVNIVDTGVGFISAAPVPDMSTLSGVGGSIRFNVSSVFFSSGEYISSRGHLSSDCRLQDGFFYQDFSYVIKSNVDIETYRGIVKRLVHPAGTGMFGELTNESNPIISGDAVKVLYHLSHPEDENYKDPDNISTRKFFEPEIQKETKYVTWDELVRQYPGYTISQIFDLYLNYFRSFLTPKVVYKQTELERSVHIAMARREADVIIDLYDERPIAEFQNMIIGDIEPYTGYPNPKISFIEVI